MDSFLDRRTKEKIKEKGIQYDLHFNFNIRCKICKSNLIYHININVRISHFISDFLTFSSID